MPTTLERDSTNTLVLNAGDVPRIRSHDPARPDHVIGNPPATRGKGFTTAMAMIEAASTLNRDASDIRLSGMAPRLKFERVAERTSAFAPKLEAGGAAYLTGRDSLRTRMHAAGRLTYSDAQVNASMVHVDLYRLNQIRGMTDAARAAHLAEVISNPPMFWHDAELLVRLPTTVTGISQAAQNAVRFGLWQVGHREEAAALVAEAEELQFLQRTVAATAAALVDLGVGASELAAAAPSALKAASDRERVSGPDARAAIASLTGTV